MHMSRLTFALIACLLASGCGMFSFLGARESYLEAQDLPRTKIPASLDKPPFEDLMAVPDVIDSRGIAGARLQIPLPERLNSSYGVEQIVIKRLGDERWIFLDSPLPSVWPKIQEFLEANNFVVVERDPSNGVTETDWLISIDGDADEIFESIRSGAAWADSAASIENRFHLQVQPGIRPGSCEISIRHKKIPLGSSEGRDDPDWTGLSDNPELESKLLSALAYALGDTINDRSISYLASRLEVESRAVLMPDKVRPILKYKLDLNRAWATVGSALKSAQIEVEDRDRTAQIYFVFYDDSVVDNPGFIRRLFSRDKKIFRGDVNRYRLHLDEASDGVHVTVRKDETTLAGPLVSERLLNIIKEYST